MFGTAKLAKSASSDNSGRYQAQNSLEQQEKLLRQLHTVSEGTKKIETRFAEAELQTNGMGISLLDLLFSKVGAFTQPSDKERWLEDLIAAIHRDGVREKKKISLPAIPNERKHNLQSILLDRLRYRGMNDRGERIAVAFENTFQWIFKDPNPQSRPWSNFAEWLESESQLYWVTGKAGSGKSTLMKFICYKEFSDAPSKLLETDKEPRCFKHLNKWAAGSKLIAASFFFWSSGTHLQMSQKGLLLSLLFQILEQCPEFWPLVSPSGWESLCLFNLYPPEWTEQELHTMLRTATHRIPEDSKLFLFVDGLDEFDGNLNDLIDLFKDTIKNSNVKVCVSSRPWVEFEDAFEHRPSLKLEDLTYTDIKSYVSGSFQKDSNFARLCIREPEYAAQLVEEVVSKASGVFLWVHLVVASLIAGMCYGDRVSDLQRRLDQLPADLSTLYEKIVLSLDPFYLEHAAQLFKLVQESIDPPSLLLLYFIDEEDPNRAINRPIEAISHNEKSLRADTMRRRLNSRCKGLLEVGGEPSAPGKDAEDTVQYLHRSVKDYMESAHVQKTFASAVKESFDPYLMLCAGNLAYLKSVQINPEDMEPEGPFWAGVRQCLHSASRFHVNYHAHVIPLLEEIDKTGRDVLQKSQLHSGNWCDFFTRGTKLDIHNISFLSLATRYGIMEYIEAKADSEHAQYLLHDAVTIFSKWEGSFRDAVPHIDTIRCLLHKGADPNYQISGTSAWAEAVRSIVKFSSKGYFRPPWAEVAVLMIQYGARVDDDVLGNIRSTFTIWRSTTIGMKELYKDLLDIQRRTPRIKLPKTQPSITKSWKASLPWYKERE